MKSGKIAKIKGSTRVLEGAGVKVDRILSNTDVYDFDPFLMLDTFDLTNEKDYIQGFPWHPHRGIETITYLIDGEVEHGDSLGNKGVIGGGDCQWMTAGSGIIHQEMPLKSNHLFGFQLWLNLPKKDKMTEPKYRDITKAKIPEFSNDDYNVKIISGNFKGKSGAIEADYVKTNIIDLSIKSNNTVKIDICKDNTLFLLILKGTLKDDGSGKIIKPQNVVLYNRCESIAISSPEKNCRCILFEAMPLEEPIAWGGPIVMNTKEELDLAFAELRSDNFIKHKI